MARLVKKHLKGYLYENDFNPRTQRYPTMNELKKKILFRVTIAFE